MVTRLETRDVDDTFRVRRVLELAAVRASRGAEPEQLAGLAAAVHELVDAAAAGDWGAIIDADELFHERLVADCSVAGDSSRFFDAIKGRFACACSIVDRSSSDPASLVAEHQELLELMLHRETDRVTELMSGHLADAEQTLAAVVASDGP